MINFSDGDILEDMSEALVNPVNCQGVMGAGLAAKFKEKFPHNYRLYRIACEAGVMKPGEVFMMDDSRTILNLATKDNWREPSQLKWVRSGMEDVLRHVDRWGLRSVAIPALGCGLGGLKWGDVLPEIERVCEQAPGVMWTIYPPK